MKYYKQADSHGALLRWGRHKARKGRRSSLKTKQCRTCIYLRNLNKVSNTCKPDVRAV